MSHAVLALRVCIWLCCLPVRLRRGNLPALLREAGPARKRLWLRIDPDDAVRITKRVCRLPPFRTALFPKACLRESLAQHYVLTRLGRAPRFHIGVRKDRGRLAVHSWTTCQESAQPRDRRESAFRVLFSHSSENART